MRIRIRLLFKAALTIFLIISLTSEPRSFAADDNQSTTDPLKTDVKGLKDEDPIPGFVEHDFRRYLECGILSHGFARAYCEGCGRDFLIAFSCKGRGVYPSCNTRRMAETAAHLVEGH